MSTGTGIVRVRIAGWSSEDCQRRGNATKEKTKTLLMKEKKIN
jgi:hypothetical protein